MLFLQSLLIPLGPSYIPVIDFHKNQTFDINTYRPKVIKAAEPGPIVVKVPLEYKEVGEPGSVPLPLASFPVEGSTTATIPSIGKNIDDLTDQDKLFLKNRLLAAMHQRYRRFVENSNRFEGMCHRGEGFVEFKILNQARSLSVNSLPEE